MKIYRKRRGGGVARSFAWRTAVLMSLFLLVSNIGYLFAQGILPDAAVLMRLAIRGDAYLVTQDLFLALRTSAIIPSFGIAIIVFVALSLAHFFTFGPKDMSAADEKDLIPWWSLTTRILHGLLAVSFVVLFISGLLITFGRFFGGGGGTLVMREWHEYAGFVFAPVLVVMILIWIAEAIPRLYDFSWFIHFGGYLGYKGQLKSGKFNAGQKMWYWIMAVAGVLLSVSGFVLFFKSGEMENLRYNVLLHFFSAIPIVLMFLVHLYMTTIGSKGAFMGMINGKFSKTAAENYHSEARQLQAQ